LIKQGWREPARVRVAALACLGLAMLYVGCAFKPVIEGDGVSYYAYLHALIIDHGLNVGGGTPCRGDDLAGAGGREDADRDACRLLSDRLSAPGAAGLPHRLGAASDGRAPVRTSFHDRLGSGVVAMRPVCARAYLPDGSITIGCSWRSPACHDHSGPCHELRLLPALRAELLPHVHCLCHDPVRWLGGSDRRPGAPSGGSWSGC
jgi:hypothetical protein